MLAARTIVPLVAGLVAMPVVAFAASPDRAAPYFDTLTLHPRIRVELASGARVEGWVDSVSTDSIVLTGPSGRRAFSRAEVERIWERGRAEPVGAAIGGAFGAAFGAFVGLVAAGLSENGTDETSAGYIAGFGGTVAGGLVGAGIGHLGHRWRSQRLDPLPATRGRYGAWAVGANAGFINVGESYDDPGWGGTVDVFRRASRSREVGIGVAYLNPARDAQFSSFLGPPGNYSTGYRDRSLVAVVPSLRFRRPEGSLRLSGRVGGGVYVDRVLKVGEIYDSGGSLLSRTESRSTLVRPGLQAGWGVQLGAGPLAFALDFRWHLIVERQEPDRWTAFVGLQFN
jgi:hypothetical protein